MQSNVTGCEEAWQDVGSQIGCQDVCQQEMIEARKACGSGTAESCASLSAPDCARYPASNATNTDASPSTSSTGTGNGSGSPLTSTSGSQGAPVDTSSTGVDQSIGVDPSTGVDPSPSKDSGSSAGLIAGVTAASVVAVLAIVLAVALLLWQRRRRQRDSTEHTSQSAPDHDIKWDQPGPARWPGSLQASTTSMPHSAAHASASAGAGSFGPQRSGLHTGSPGQAVMPGSAPRMRSGALPPGDGIGLTSQRSASPAVASMDAQSATAGSRSTGQGDALCQRIAPLPSGAPAHSTLHSAAYTTQLRRCRRRLV